MFDVVGEAPVVLRLSLAITIPGLLFILLTLIPGARLGLQFSIAYTGGTMWDVHFRDGTPNPDAVVAMCSRSRACPGRWSRTAPTPAGSTSSSEPPRSRSARADQRGRHAVPGRRCVTFGQPSPGAAASPSAAASLAASPGPVHGRARRSPDPSRIRPAGRRRRALAFRRSGNPARLGGAAHRGPPGRDRDRAPGGVRADRRGAPDHTVGPVVSAELLQQTFLLIVIGRSRSCSGSRSGSATSGWAPWPSSRCSTTSSSWSACSRSWARSSALQVDALFVTAMLTVIGFSVHDTIVVFDRIRENRVRHAGEPYEAIVNHSILQTAGRSINTSLTIVLTLAALLPVRWRRRSDRSCWRCSSGSSPGRTRRSSTPRRCCVDWQLWDERRRARQVAAQALGPTGMSPQARPSGCHRSADKVDQGISGGS